MLGYLGSCFGYFFFEKPVTHIFHDFSVDLGVLALAYVYCVIMNYIDTIFHFYVGTVGRKVYYFKTKICLPLYIILDHFYPRISLTLVLHEILYCESLSQKDSAFRVSDPVIKKNKITDQHVKPRKLTSR